MTNILEFATGELNKHKNVNNELFKFDLSLINILNVYQYVFFDYYDNSVYEIMNNVWKYIVDSQFKNCKSFRCRRGQIICLNSITRRKEQQQKEEEDVAMCNGRKTWW
jgi:hypothetical protein